MIYRRNANTAWRMIDGETIVMHLHAKEIFGLNETGGKVWHALDGSVTSEVLSAHFGIVWEQLAAFCAALQEQGLLEVVESTEVPSKPCLGFESRPSGDRRTGTTDPPRILSREEIRQVVGNTCAFMPPQNPLCTQVPFS